MTHVPGITFRDSFIISATGTSVLRFVDNNFYLKSEGFLKITNNTSLQQI